jgi:hypothetical protein
MKLSELCGKYVRHPASYLHMRVDERGEKVLKETFTPCGLGTPAIKWVAITLDDFTLSELSDEQWIEDPNPEE